MLVLTRRLNEEIVIAGNIRVTILECGGHHVRIGIAAPAAVAVDRLEVHERRLLDGATAPPPAAGPADDEGVPRPERGRGKGGQARARRTPRVGRPIPA